MYFFIVVFTQFVSRIPHALSGNLNCVNDFEATMACVLTYDKHVNCSGYNLVLVPSLSNKNYVCTLTENSSNSYSPFKCGCTVQIPKPITGDEYTANLLKGLNTVNSVKIKPSEKIKPKAPVIISVNRTDTGNFNVTWKTNYLESTPFSESLKTQLSYKMKGDSDEVAKTINATLPFQEILGTELKANRDYVIKARSFSMKFNSQFSDWSQEVEWTNPVSTQDLLKIVIPVLCLLLIINICVCHRCYMKLKASCDKIPDPAKAPLDKIIPTNVKVLQPPKDPPISPIDVFSMEKPCKHLLSEGSSVPVETDPGYKSVSSHSSGKDSGLSSSPDSRPQCLIGSQGSLCSTDSCYRSIPYGLVSVEKLTPPEQPVKFLMPPSTSIAADSNWSPSEVFRVNAGETNLQSRFQSSSDVDHHIVKALSCSVNPAYAGLPSHSCTLAPCEEGYQAHQRLLLQNSTDVWSSMDSDDQEVSVDSSYQEVFSETEFGQVIPQFPVPKGIPGIITCISGYESVQNLREEDHLQRKDVPQTTICPLQNMQILVDDSYHRM